MLTDVFLILELVSHLIQKKNTIAKKCCSCFTKNLFQTYYCVYNLLNTYNYIDPWWLKRCVVCICMFVFGWWCLHMW